MPEFLLRYKVPKEFTLDWEIESVQKQALEMAAQIQAKASETFFGWDVSCEVREFADTMGQSDFVTTGWVTDNDDAFVQVVLEAQEAILALMRELAFTDQTVECWWWRVKGKWDGAKGLKERPSRQHFLP